MSEPPRRLFRRSTATRQEQRRRAESAADEENVLPVANPPATPPKRPLPTSPSSRPSPSLSESCHGPISPSLSEVCHGAASPSLSEACHQAASPSLPKVCHGAASPSLSEVCHGAPSPSLSEACHTDSSPLPFRASKRPSPPSIGASTRLSQRVIEYEQEVTPRAEASHEPADRSSADDGRRAGATVAAAQLGDPRAALRQHLDALSLADALQAKGFDSVRSISPPLDAVQAEGCRQQHAPPLGPHQVMAIDGVDVHWPTPTVGPPLAPQRELMHKLLRAVRNPEPEAEAEPEPEPEPEPES